MATQSSSLIFAQCAPGLEPFLAAELSQCGVQGQVVVGGVEARVSEPDLLRACFTSRLADSIRIRLKAFEARDFTRLVGGLKRLPFRAYLDAGVSYRLQVVCHKSKLWHSGAVEERAHQVITEHVGWVRADDDEEAQLVHVRLQDDQVQLSLDAAGRMHRRGYRPHVEQASLRETLAAALLWVAQPEVPRDNSPVLWDPFCGAGTILLEAAHQAVGHPAGALRRLPLEHWRMLAEVNWDELRKLSVETRWKGLHCVGSDLSDKAIDAARHNAESAGLAELIQWEVGDVQDVAARIPQGAFVVTNPPYGKRIQEVEGVQKLMRVLAARPDLRPAVALLGGKGREVVPKTCPALFRTKNGGLAVSARQLDGATASGTSAARR